MFVILQLLWEILTSDVFLYTIMLLWLWSTMIDQAFGKMIEQAFKTEKTEQENRRCKHPKHSTTHVKKSGECARAWKCKEKGQEGCIIA